MFCVTDSIAICSLCLRSHREHDILDELEIVERDKSMKSIINSNIKKIQSEGTLSTLKMALEG